MKPALMVVVICFSLTQLHAGQQLTRDSRYPAHWFAPVSDVGKPEWEILPQEAGQGEVILSKRNELGLLSNFAATPFIFRGKRYASLEGFWQMMLYPEGPTDSRAKVTGITWNYTREQVSQMTAFEAKTAGTLAEDNMACDGDQLGHVRRKAVRLPVGISTHSLSTDCCCHLGQGKSES
jgi:hypothetical protein